MTAPDQTRCGNGPDAIPDVCESVRALDYAQCARRRGHEGDHRDLWGSLWSEGDEPVSYDPARAEQVAAETVRADAELIQQAVIDGLGEAPAKRGPQAPTPAALELAASLEHLAGLLRSGDLPAPVAKHDSDTADLCWQVNQAADSHEGRLALVNQAASALGVDAKHEPAPEHNAIFHTARAHLDRLRVDVTYVERVPAVPTEKESQ